jgi:hypothetical protein
VSSGNGVSLAAADGLRLEIVDAAGATAHLGAWEELADAAEEPNVFLSPFMLLPACRAFGGRRQLRLCFFHAPHPTHKLQPPVLVGFAALEERRSRLRLPIPILGSFHHPAIHLGTPLCRPGYTRKVVEALLDHIGQRRRVVTMQEIRGDGPFHEALVDGLNRRGWTHVGLRRATRALLVPDVSAEAYLTRALVGKRRKELRRQRDRLGEQGVLELVTLARDEDPRPWLDAFLTLEAAGWKGKDQDGEALASTPETRSFFLEAMTEGHRQGRLHLTALRLDGAFIAMKCNLLAGTGSFAFKIAFDERYARFSPGVQLELETIRWFHEQVNVSKTRWMDSCAHHSRFMINHLWSARRPVESMAFATGHATAALLVALLPAVGWARERLSRQEVSAPPSKQLPTPATEGAQS